MAFSYYNQINYAKSEDMQHAINSWVKLGFIPIEVTWTRPGFKLTAPIDNSFIRKSINTIKELIDEAHSNGNFEEVIRPAEFANCIFQFDKKERTSFFEKYKDQLDQLEKYYEDKDFFNKPMIKIMKEITKEEVTEGTKDLIPIGPRGVNNQTMIPAISNYVYIGNDENLQKLKQLYPNVFESSRKYLGKRIQKYLQNKGI